MKIGLTGGIASGKSLVSAFFRAKRIPVVDADVIAKRVVEPGEPALDQIVKTFGDHLLTPKGDLNRKALGSIVFNDQSKRHKLNAIIHPAVRMEMKRQVDAYEQAGHPIIVLDIPLLIENNLFHLVDQVWVVYVDESTQLVRLMTRDASTEEEALQRINAQIPLSEKCRYADVLIDNRHSEEDTYKQVDIALEKIAYR